MLRELPLASAGRQHRSCHPVVGLPASVRLAGLIARIDGLAMKLGAGFIQHGDRQSTIANAALRTRGTCSQCGKLRVWDQIKVALPCIDADCPISPFGFAMVRCDESIAREAVWLAGRVVPCHNCNHRVGLTRAAMMLFFQSPGSVLYQALELSGNEPVSRRPRHRCEMKNLNFATEVHLKLGAPSSHTVESLRLLRAFLKLAPRQRFEVIKLVEDLAAEDVVSDRPLS